MNRFFAQVIKLALIIACLSPLSCSADAPAPAPAENSIVTGSENGVWLGHAYVTTQSWATTRVPALAADMKSKQMRYWFVNIGKLDKEGKLVKADYNTSKAATFLNSLKTWEDANNYQFKVFAWISGSVDDQKDDYVNVGDAAVRGSMITECRKLLFAAEPQGYIAAAQREFDGVQLDLEPSGADAARFEQLKTLMDELGKSIGNKLTSFCAHKIGTENRYWWSPTFYHYMARRVDVLCAMTYDTGLKDGTEYQKWMQEQTAQILRAVSGELWKNDEAHPAPTRNVKVLIGLPAFPANKYSLKEVEAIHYAATGTQSGLAELEQQKSPSLKNFSGVAVYLHTDGTGKDSYASEADWTAYRRDWLGEH